MLMNTSLAVAAPTWRAALPFCLLASALASPAQANPDAPAAAAETKTHTLFMGADILVEQNKQAYPVEDVVGGSFVINVDGKVVKVPANWGEVKMKVARSLKLAGTNVSVDRLKADRAYTSGNDPVKKFMAQQGEMMAAQDAMAARAATMATAQVTSSVAAHSTASSPAGPVQGLPSPWGDPSAAERSFNAAGASAQSAFSRDAGFVGTMQDELAKELFDAIDVEFDVSSAERLAKPYVVIMAQVREKDGKPGESRNWLYAAELDPLDTKPQKVRVKQGGFSPGYELVKYQVHVYDGGQEVATNVAENQVPLTRREAFAYLLLEYLGTHKGQTQPAAPVLGRINPEVRARLGADQLKHTYFVKVSKDGLPGDAYLDEACSRAVENAVLKSVIMDVRFYPALEKGRPVDGLAPVKLRDLQI
jgi:hypothetical protein